MQRTLQVSGLQCKALTLTHIKKIYNESFPVELLRQCRQYSKGVEENFRALLVVNNKLADAFLS